MTGSDHEQARGAADSVWGTAMTDHSCTIPNESGHGLENDTQTAALSSTITEQLHKNKTKTYF